MTMQVQSNTVRAIPELRTLQRNCVFATKICEQNKKKSQPQWYHTGIWLPGNCCFLLFANLSHNSKERFHHSFKLVSGKSLNDIVDSQSRLAVIVAPEGEKQVLQYSFHCRFWKFWKGKERWWICATLVYVVFSLPVDTYYLLTWHRKVRPRLLDQQNWMHFSTKKACPTTFRHAFCHIAQDLASLWQLRHGYPRCKRLKYLSHLKRYQNHRIVRSNVNSQWVKNHFWALIKPKLTPVSAMLVVQETCFRSLDPNQFFKAGQSCLVLIGAVDSW